MDGPGSSDGWAGRSCRLSWEVSGSREEEKGGWPMGWSVEREPQGAGSPGGLGKEVGILSCPGLAPLSPGQEDPAHRGGAAEEACEAGGQIIAPTWLIQGKSGRRKICLWDPRDPSYLPRLLSALAPHQCPLLMPN